MIFIKQLSSVPQKNHHEFKKGMTMKVAIVGSRQYTNKKRIQEFVFKLKQKYGDELEIVSGGQKDGADGYAKKYALEFDIKYSEFPPSHYAYNQHCVLESYKYGRPYAAWHYHDRNKKIVLVRSTRAPLWESSLRRFLRWGFCSSCKLPTM